MITKVHRKHIVITAIAFLLSLGALGIFQYTTLKLSKTPQQKKTTDEQIDTAAKDLSLPQTVSPTTNSPSREEPAVTSETLPKTQNLGTPVVPVPCYKVYSDSDCLTQEEYDAVMVLNKVQPIPDTPAPSPTVIIGEQ